MRKDYEVFENLIARRSGKQQDGRKIGLLLPGAGMSGVFSGGVAQALEANGLSDQFDTIYSYSSGAATAAYMLSGNTALGSSIYSEELAGFQFFQPWKPYHWMNIDHFTNVIRNVKPLAPDKIRSSKTELKIQVTNTRDGSVKWFSNHGFHDIVQIIRASCAYPGYAAPCDIDGGFYCDGGVTEFVTINQLTEDDCTDILVVAPVPEKFTRKVFDIGHLPSYLFLKRYGSRFKLRYRNMKKNHNEYLLHLLSDDLPKDVNIYVIAPKFELSPMVIGKNKLKKYENHGITCAQACIDQPQSSRE